MSETLPASSVARKETVPLSSMTMGAVYSVQVSSSSEYSFTALSSLKVAVMVTLPLVGTVISATTLGASGAVMSVTVTVKISWVFSIASE